MHRFHLLCCDIHCGNWWFNDSCNERVAEFFVRRFPLKLNANFHASSHVRAINQTAHHSPKYDTLCQLKHDESRRIEKLIRWMNSAREKEIWSASLSKRFTTDNSEWIGIETKVIRSNLGKRMMQPTAHCTCATPRFSNFEKEYDSFVIP